MGNCERKMRVWKEGSLKGRDLRVMGGFFFCYFLMVWKRAFFGLVAFGVVDAQLTAVEVVPVETVDRCLARRLLGELAEAHS